MELEMRGIAMFVIGMLALGVIISYFILGVQMSGVEAQRIFMEGCLRYCPDIKISSSENNIALEVAAVRKAEMLKGSTWVKACEILYSDTIGYPYLCWNRHCCNFELAMP